jgi:hypothetical protein
MIVIDEECDQLFAACLVDRVKASVQGAVEVEHAQNLSGRSREGGKQRHDELGARVRVARDMAREIADVGNQNRGSARGRGAANALAQRDPCAGPAYPGMAPAPTPGLGGNKRRPS